MKSAVYRRIQGIPDKIPETWKAVLNAISVLGGRERMEVLEELVECLEYGDEGCQSCRLRNRVNASLKLNGSYLKPKDWAFKGVFLQEGDSYPF